MLGRIAESAGLGHSFWHNALMKCSTEKESKQQKGPCPPRKTKKPTLQHKTGLVSSKKPGQLLFGTGGERKFPAADFLSLQQSH